MQNLRHSLLQAVEYHLLLHSHVRYPRKATSCGWRLRCLVKVNFPCHVQICGTNVKMGSHFPDNWTNSQQFKTSASASSVPYTCFKPSTISRYFNVCFEAIRVIISHPCFGGTNGNVPESCNDLRWYDPYYVRPALAARKLHVRAWIE